MKFKDHFSKQAADYAKFRPHYPAELFNYLARLSPARHLAWDCATGNGQAAIGLAKYFERVIATDASARQIESAEKNQRVTYRVAPAEASGLENNSIALVTVAQALHWLDLEKFFAEVQRVLRRDGIIAVWSYNLLAIAPAVDAIVGKFYRETTANYWPPERALVEDGYRQIAFPFQKIAPPAFEMEASWTMAQLLGYLRTWSATQKFVEVNGFDPVEKLTGPMRAAWGEDEGKRVVCWPLTLRVGKHRTLNIERRISK